MIFRDRSSLRTPDCPTFEFEDKDGDVCCIQFYRDDEGECGLVELQVYSETGCVVLSADDAESLARKILECVK